MSYVDYVLEQSKSFLDDFIVKKVNDICNHLTLFYNYLSIPRENFKLVKKPFWVGTNKCIKILNDYEKKRLKVNTLRCERPIVNKHFCELHTSAKLEDNITSELISTKRINKEMVTYLFNEIYNCKNFTTTTNIVEFVGREKQHIFNEIYQAIDQRFSNRSIKDVLYSYLNDGEIVIPNEIESLIIKYVAICIYNMMFIDLGVDDLNAKYNEMQQYVLSVKKDYIDYNLQSENYNVALQSFVYIITALMDWLELDDVSTDEVETAFKIILYSGYKDRIEKIINLNNREIELRSDEKKEFVETFERYKSNVSLAFKDLNLYADEDVSDLILRYVFLLCNIYYLDDKCTVYFSYHTEVKEFYSLLSRMFEGCYRVELITNELGSPSNLSINGKIQESYANTFELDNINREHHIIISLPYNLGRPQDSENFIILYTDKEGKLEDKYVVYERLLETNNKTILQFYTMARAAYSKLLEK